MKSWVKLSVLVGAALFFGGQSVALAQQAALYEEDKSDPQGKRYAGTTAWSVDRGATAGDLAVRAQVTIPDKKLSASVVLRRNLDKALPATHTIEITFKTPPGTNGGGVANTPGVLMKREEQARGSPLAGLSVKVTTNVFLIGLSAAPVDVERNTVLLRDLPWFDVPFVYDNGSRGVLALEKGESGNRAFADAFAAWPK